MAQRKNKLAELDQIDAKDVGGQGSFRNLDALLGEDSSNPYKTFDLNVYEGYINELNSTDLHRHAEKIGLVPTSDRRVLKERLFREFKRFVASRAPNKDVDIFSVKPLGDESSISDEARKILREGA
jgi:hypothetical protein